MKTAPQRIEPLEARIAPAALVGNVLTYTYTMFSHYGSKVLKLGIGKAT